MHVVTYIETRLLDLLEDSRDVRLVGAYGWLDKCQRQLQLPRLLGCAG